MEENSTWVDDPEFWRDAQEVPSTSAAFHSLGMGLEEGGLGFVPPPPRPSLFALEPELGSEAFAATCDLCDWAWRDQTALTANRSQLTPGLPTVVLGGEIGWLLTLAAVALLSAVIGAAVMVTVLHCRRLKGSNNGGGSGGGACCGPAVDEDDTCSSRVPPSPGQLRGSGGLGIADGASKTPPLPEARRHAGGTDRGCWWRRILDLGVSGGGVGGGSRGRDSSCSLPRRAPRRLCPPAPPANENHYTVTEPPTALPPIPAVVTPPGIVPAATAEEEALYAELHERTSGYQNTGYLQQVSESDLPSAPSSAYYSDLSCGGERTYEAVQGDDEPPTLLSWPPPPAPPPGAAPDLPLHFRGPVTITSSLRSPVQNSVPGFNDLGLTCRVATITKTVPSDYV